jgi:hypothetical protein
MDIFKCPKTKTKVIYKHCADLFRRSLIKPDIPHGCRDCPLGLKAYKRDVEEIRQSMVAL